MQPAATSLKVLDNVRETTKAVSQEAQHVFIRDAGVKALASTLRGLLGGPESVAWDEGGWHYTEDAAQAGPLTCQYIMVLDALNFCFWPTEGLEYEHLARALTTVIKADPTAFDARRLSNVTESIVASWVRDFQLPKLAERTRKVREVGQVLHECFDGLAANLVARADHSVETFVRLVTSHFPGFRDEAVYKGCQVFFYKRAQILAGDIWGAYGRQRSPHPFGFDDVTNLSMFADYRVPQILRAKKVLEYSPALAAAVDGLQLLPPGSEEEVEIRACTVQAVEEIKKELTEQGVEEVMSLTLDWLLWQEGEKLKDQIPPHHRTLTVFY